MATYPSSWLQYLGCEQTRTLIEGDHPRARKAISTLELWVSSAYTE